MSRDFSRKTDESTLTTPLPRCLMRSAMPVASVSAVQTPDRPLRSLAPTARPALGLTITSSPPARKPPTLRKDGLMMNLNALKVDPEFQGKIPPLTFEELNQLEANILRDGRIINPIIVWRG